MFVVFLTVLVVVFAPIYYVGDGSGGDVIWNSGQAYVFMTVVHRGYRMNCLRLVAEFLLRSFIPFGASVQDNKSSSVIVLRIAPGNLQRFDFDKMNAGGMFDPFGKDVYTRDIDTGVLMKWSGDRFEPASVEEQRSLFAARASDRIPAGPSYDNINGWSKRATGGKVGPNALGTVVEEDARVVIQVNGRPATLVMNSGFITHEAFIDIVRSDEGQQRIWYLDERTHRVTKAEYLHTFGLR